MLSSLQRAVLLTTIDGVQLALPALDVREIVRAAAITPFPGAPDIIEGSLNIRGSLIPVVNVRARLGLPAKTLSSAEFIVIVSAGERTIAVRVDDVNDVVQLPAGELLSSDALSPVLKGLEGLAPTESGTLVLYDTQAFLTQAEGVALDTAAALMK